MTSFGWKKKSGDRVSRTALAAFEDNALGDEEIDAAVLGEGEIDWLSLQQSAKRSKVIALEDNLSKAARLKNEGAVLAEEERYWEAIKKWDAALDLKPNDEKVYEMKAQAYMALSEVFPALSAAQKAVQLNPLWWIGYQTLGRAHLGLGEVRTAILQFSRAVHINPADRDLWEEDLLWAQGLWLQKQRMSREQTEHQNKEETANSTVTVTELDGELSDEEKAEEAKKAVSVYQRTECSEVTEDSTGSGTPADDRRERAVHLPAGYVKMRDVT